VSRQEIPLSCRDGTGPIGTPRQKKDANFCFRVHIGVLAFAPYPGNTLPENGLWTRRRRSRRVGCVFATSVLLLNCRTPVEFRGHGTMPDPEPARHRLREPAVRPFLQRHLRLSGTSTACAADALARQGSSMPRSIRGRRDLSLTLTAVTRKIQCLYDGWSNAGRHFRGNAG